MLSVGKWGSNTGWYFDMKALKGARLCCRKSVPVRGLLVCSPYKSQLLLASVSPTHLAVLSCVAAAVQKSPPHAWVCLPLFACCV